MVRRQVTSQGIELLYSLDLEVGLKEMLEIKYKEEAGNLPVMPHKKRSKSEVGYALE